MDIPEIKELLGWVIGTLFVGITTTILGIISLIKSAKLVSRDVKQADLSNTSKELSIADQFDILATKAAQKAISWQERFDKLEQDYCQSEENYKNLEDKYEELSKKVESQDVIIKQQAIIISEQTIRLDSQDIKIKEQEEEIEHLKCELGNAKSYNEALIQQMREQSMIPIEQSRVTTEDCEKIKSKKRISRKGENNDS